MALQETVKILDSDKSLDLFRKKASSLLQVDKDVKGKKDRALELVLKAKGEAHPELNFLALALSGRKVDFSKIVKKIDSMVELLKTEQKDDVSKKDYCGKEFHEAELKGKSVGSAITSLSTTVAGSLLRNLIPITLFRKNSYYVHKDTPVVTMYPYYGYLLKVP